MTDLKKRLSGAGKLATVALRFATACVLFASFLQFGGKVNVFLMLAGLALGCILVWFCSFKVKGFGAAAGLFLEYYSFHGQFADEAIRVGMLAAAFALYFGSLTRPRAKK